MVSKIINQYNKITEELTLASREYDRIKTQEKIFLNEVYSDIKKGSITLLSLAKEDKFTAARLYHVVIGVDFNTAKEHIERLLANDTR